MMNRRIVMLGVAASGIAACGKPDTSAVSSAKTKAPESGELFGKVEVFDDKLSDVIDANLQLEKLSSGFQWSEGPVWHGGRKTLYFTDVPQNTIYSWSEANGLGVYKKPSGLPDAEVDEAQREPGANGLWMARDGRMLACIHSKRCVVAIDLDTGAETVLFDSFEGRKFNSPNDLVEAANGDVFFTDPPYGFKDQDNSPLQEQPVNGVYRGQTDGTVTLVDGSLARPNGVALSPDGRTLYVANSEGGNFVIKHYRLENDGSATDLGVFYDASPLSGEDAPGSCDGLCVAETGHIFATGPGGVLVLNSEGALLGRVNTGRPTANCTFGENGSTLFVTANDTLARIRLRVRGRVYPYG